MIGNSLVREETISLVRLRSYLEAAGVLRSVPTLTACQGCTIASVLDEQS
jgi:hypothetical protein